MDEKLVSSQAVADKEIAAFHGILEVLHRTHGVDFRQYREKCLRRRISLRMHDHKVETYQDYLRILIAAPEEFEKLLDKITINVTEFFRNPETYEAVRRDVLPQLLAEKKKIGSSVIRVWSAGCSSGEEPYSLAIMLRESCVGEYRHFLPHIYATDIDEQALSVARQGIYPERSLATMSAAQRQGYFSDTGGGWRIRDDFRPLIRFVRHNMVTDAPFNRVDLIFCRNVIIYFTRELQRELYRNFHAALNPGGFLVAGRVESLLGISEDLFERVSLSEKIFRKSLPAR